MPRFEPRTRWGKRIAAHDAALRAHRPADPADADVPRWMFAVVLIACVGTVLVMALVFLIVRPSAFEASVIGTALILGNAFGLRALARRLAQRG